MSSPARQIRASLKRALGPLSIDETYLAFQLLRRGGPGVMIDVGAHWGESLAAFAGEGWTVHAFEPDADNRTVIEQQFGGDSRVHLTAAAVSDHVGEQTLFRSETSSSISSLASFHESHAESDVVALTTLSVYLQEAGANTVDMLKIDVEGYEREVLDGYDWNLLPRAVVAEFEDRKTQPRGYSWVELANTLTSHGLKVLVSEWEPIEEYGAKHRWRAFKPYPCELDSPDAWGNLIAVQPALWSSLRRGAARMQAMALAGRALGR